ncbi:MAG: carboxypeptidase-like regulatory domain-containing protein [Pyrinomonadaceae bacterium]
MFFAAVSTVARSQTASLRVGFRDPACHGTPIKGVKVKVEGHRFSKTFKTDPTGFFTVSKLPHGTYRITTLKYGFKNTIIEHIELSRGGIFEHTFELERGYASDDGDPNIGNPRYDWCKHEDKKWR